MAPNSARTLQQGAAGALVPAPYYVYVYVVRLANSRASTLNDGTRNHAAVAKSSAALRSAGVPECIYVYASPA